MIDDTEADHDTDHDTEEEIRKQEGESCGRSRGKMCGLCDKGLRCRKRWKNRCGTCGCGKCVKKKDTNKIIKQEGEECGPCSNPENDFHCGTCAPGLDCKEDTISGPQIPLPGLAKKCRKKIDKKRPHYEKFER